MKKVKVQDLLKKTQKDLHQDLEKLQLELNKLRVEATMRKPSEDNKKFHAHDEKEEAHVGDLVTIEECIPLSKSKSWVLKTIDKKVTKLQRQLQGVEI